MRNNLSMCLYLRVINAVHDPSFFCIFLMAVVRFFTLLGLQYQFP